MKFSRFLLRGILGGLIGAPLFLVGDAIHNKLRMGYVPYGGAFQLMAVPYFLIAGVVLGAIIGCIVWALQVKARIKLSRIESCLVGVSFIFLLMILLYVISLINAEQETLIPPTAMEQFIDRLFQHSGIRSLEFT